MADKTTTLKTKTNDNVYPNIIGDNRKNAFVDSLTIKHHFYDQTHKVGFQIANETNIKIQNSLQKPSGLTKTKLVGVGKNGQENIEIGDNLTLANGKLSATGGGSGGGDFDIVTISDDGKTYTGTISGTKPVIIKIGGVYFIPTQSYYDNGVTTCYIITDKTTTILVLENGNKTSYEYSNLYSHFITLTLDNDKIYINFENGDDASYDMNYLVEKLSGKKVICTGHLGNSDETKADPKFVSGEAGGLEVYYILQNDTSGTLTSKSITYFTITDLVSPM